MSRQMSRAVVRFIASSPAGSTELGFLHSGTSNWKGPDVSCTSPHHLGRTSIATHGFGARIQVCISPLVLELFGCWSGCVLPSWRGVCLLYLLCPLLHEPMSVWLCFLLFTGRLLQEIVCLLGRDESCCCLPLVGLMVKECLHLSSST